MKASPKYVVNMADVPAQYRKVFERAFSGKSPGSAIKAKCLLCSCFDRQEIQKCPVRDCSLFPYRPYQPAGAQKPPSQ